MLLVDLTAYGQTVTMARYCELLNRRSEAVFQKISNGCVAWVHPAVTMPPDATNQTKSDSVM